MSTLRTVHTAPMPTDAQIRTRTNGPAGEARRRRCLVRRLALTAGAAATMVGCASTGARFNTDLFDRRWEARSSAFAPDSTTPRFSREDLDLIRRRWGRYARHAEDSLLVAYMEILGGAFARADSASCIAMQDRAAPPWANVDSVTAEEWVVWVEAAMDGENRPRPTRPVLPSAPADSLQNVLMHRLGNRYPDFPFHGPGDDCALTAAFISEAVRLPTPLAAAFMRARMADLIGSPALTTPAPSAPRAGGALDIDAPPLDVAAEIIWCPGPKAPLHDSPEGGDTFVHLAFVIGADGRAERNSIRVLEASHWEIRSQAIQAVAHCLFQPRLVLGQPTPSHVALGFEYTRGG